MRRTYRVSDKFANELIEIQKETKENGIIKTQEQILDEMMEIYLKHQNEKDNEIFQKEVEDKIIKISDEYYQSVVKMYENFIQSIDKRNDALDEKVNEFISKCSKR